MRVATRAAKDEATASQQESEEDAIAAMENKVVRNFTSCALCACLQRLELAG